jgi:hypothetical protein
MASTRSRARFTLATTRNEPTLTPARARRHRRRAALVVAGLAGVAACWQPAAVRADLTSTTPAQTALSTLLFGPSTPGLQTLPADGSAALVQAIDAVAADIGVPTDATAQVAAAQLPNDVTSRLAVVLEDMHACDTITAAALTQLQPAVTSPLGDSMPSIPATSVAALRGCAATMYTDGLALKDYVKTVTAAGSAPGPGNVLDVWPVVHLDYTGAGHEYDWDYALSVATGNNTFYNNAGSNVLDPFNGPLNGQPSRGCELVSEILGANVPMCILASGMLIQVGGNSTFGRFQTPDADAFMPGTSPPVPCTTGNLVRRLFIEGSSVAGVGILINDSQGRNTYLGKVGTQGTGHIGGVGILHIEGGTNLLDAIRNGQGFGFIGGLGILHSKNARNTFINYMPLANAPGDASTTGTGIVDDAGHCEGRPRHLQGSGELGGTGVLYAEQSNGVYNSDTDLAQGTGDIFPPGTPQPNLGGPGSGILVSRDSDRSRYYGVPGRAEGTAVVGVRASLQQPSVTATDIFDDDVFPLVGSDPCGHGCAPDAQVLAPLLLSMT